MKIENAVVFNYASEASYNLSMESKAQLTGGNRNDGTQAINLKYGKENFSGGNLSTRIYADKVIKTALKSIESGENVAENKKIIQIFGPIIHEDPQKIIYG